MLNMTLTLVFDPRVTLRDAFGVPLHAVGVVVSAGNYGTNLCPNTQVDARIHIYVLSYI